MEEHNIYEKVTKGKQKIRCMGDIRTTKDITI